MTDWKKTGKRLLIGLPAALLLVLLGVAAYMEIHFGCYELSITSTDTEKILRRVPEAAVTEEDKALWAELLELPSVQGLLEGGENGEIHTSEEPDVMAAAGKYLNEKEAGSLCVSTSFFEDGSVAYMSWREGKSLSYLQIKPEEGGPAYYKLYSPKQGTTYENWDNTGAMETAVRRRWFAWLRDGMWKEGE